MDYPIALPDQLPAQLRSLRKARGLSQAELAQKLGVSQSRVAAIEHNPAAVSVGQLLRILGELEVELVLRDTAPAHAAQSTPASTKFGQPDGLPKGEW